MKKHSTVRIIYRDINKKEEKRQFEMKDIFIPVITALVFTILNQFVFYDNQKTEKFLEYEFEMLKQQRPVLNRIMAFTYRYEMTHFTYTTKTYFCSDDSTQLILNTKTGKPFEKIANIQIELPSFACDSISRTRFLIDINHIYEKIDFVDHEVYVAFDEILLFIEQHPLPEKYDEENFMKSEWRSEEIQNQWLQNITALRNITFKKMYYCENCD